MKKPRICLNTCARTMVRNSLPLIVAVILASCNQETGQNTDVAAKMLQEHPTAVKDRSHGLYLNEGKKWLVDEATAQHATLMEDIVAQTGKNAQPDLDQYVATGTAMQSAIREMISSCKTKGDDHNALHQWLEPLMAKVALLCEAATLADARVAYEEVNKQVGLFDDFFQAVSDKK